MATHYTASDAANTAVRAFLTTVGEFYWGKQFNNATGEAKIIWEGIRDNVFNGKCCYCGEKKDLTIEHLVMMSKEQYGLHHPGNIAPACRVCNRRTKNGDGKYFSWQETLKLVCSKRSEMDLYDARRQKILDHVTKGRFAYPPLDESQRDSIRSIASEIYDATKSVLDKSQKRYFETVKDKRAERILASNRGQGSSVYLS